MEGACNFAVMFVEFWEQREMLQLAKFLSQSEKYLQSVSNNQIGILFEKLFDEQRGIHVFIWQTIDRPVVPRSHDTAVRESFNLLGHLIKNYPDELKPFLAAIFQVCSRLMIRNISQLTLRAVHDTLAAFVEIFPMYSTGYEGFIKSFMDKSHLLKIKERCYMVHIVSLMAYQHPSLSELQTHGFHIQRVIINDLVKTTRYATTWDFHQLNILIDSLAKIAHYSALENTPSEMNVYGAVKKVIDRIVDDIDKYIETAEHLIKYLILNMSEFEKIPSGDDHNLWLEFFNKAADTETLRHITIDALRGYYRELGIHINVEPNCSARPILDSFLANLKVSLFTDYGNLNILSRDVVGFSQLAKCTLKIFGQDEVKELYLGIFRRVYPLFFDEQHIKVNFEVLINYQEALIEILVQLKDVITIEEVKCIARIFTIVVKRFPELSQCSQQHVIDSLKRAIENLEHIEKRYYNEFLSTVVREGIIWSCSHPLVIDIEIENMSDRQISYKNYLVLWQFLLADKSQEDHTPDEMAIQLLNTLETLSSKLNLTVKSREGNIFSDIAMSQVAENDTDFRIFINLVDLYSDILSYIARKCSLDDLRKSLQSLIKLSNKNPLISGFYRLVSKMLNVMTIHERTGPHFELVKSYLIKSLNMTFQFSHELQMSCIQLIIHVPINYVSVLIGHVAPIFQLAFKIGLANYEFADEALDGLQNYLYASDNESVKCLLLAVLPSLDIYIRSNENLDNPKKQVIKAAQNLEELQMKILMFLGQIDNTIMRQFLYEQAQNTGATWDKKNLLEYQMTFPDGSLMVPLDTILPRIIELALNSSDRRTRISSCEALHSIIIIVLGNTIQYLSAHPNRFAGLYKTTFPVLLKLGCDHDEIIRQIFNPFMLQITHWMSSLLMRSSQSTQHLIECFFDGLCDNHNASIKDFSCICLREFVSWSIKESSGKNISNALNNIHQVVQNIKTFALHPLENKKIAAALAFSHIHDTLFTKREVVDYFWLEFLYCFVASMQFCVDSRITAALDHAVQDFIQRSELFMRKSIVRIVPHGFGSGKLEDCLGFLIDKCQHPDKTVRRKLLALYVEIYSSGCEIYIPNLPIFHENVCSKLYRTTSEWLQTPMHMRNNIERVTAAIDIYRWFIQHNFIDFSLLFDDFSNRYMLVFIEILSDVNNNWINGNNNSSQDGGFTNGKLLKLLQQMIDLVIEIFNRPLSGPHQEIMNSFILGDEFMKMLCGLLFHHDILGINRNDPELKEFMQGSIKNFFSWENFKNKFHKTLFLCVNNEYSIFEIDNINAVTEQHKATLESFILLSECYPTWWTDRLIFIDLSEVLDAIFQRLKYMNASSNNWCPDLSDNLIAYYGAILKIFSTNMSMWPLFPWETNEILHCRDGSSITRGEHFFLTFQDFLMPQIVEKIEENLKILIDVPNCHKNFATFIINKIAIWLEKHRTTHQASSTKFAICIIDMYGLLKDWMNNNMHRTVMLKNIYSIAIRLKPSTIDLKTKNIHLYEWIIKQITECPTISEKSQLLDNYLVGLINETDFNSEIKYILPVYGTIQQCRSANGTVKSMTAAEFVGLFQTLYKALPATKSLILLEAVIDLGKQIEKFSTNTPANDHLHIFFNSISEGKAIAALAKIYDNFINTQDIHSKLYILRNILCPVFDWCSESTVLHFFKMHITKFISMISHELPSNGQDELQYEIERIAAYNLLEIMFTTLKMEIIDNPQGEIGMRAAGGFHDITSIAKMIYKKIIYTRQWKINEYNKEIWRLSHCASLNCAIKIATLWNEEKSYTPIFYECHSQDILIWKKIIDCSKKYELSQTFQELPKRQKILTNIKQVLEKQQKIPQNYTYARSYNLASSTLREDIFCYDMNEIIPLEEPAVTKVSVTLETDDLNNHECMAKICGVIKVYYDEYVRSFDILPTMFKTFIDAFSNYQYNIQLHLLKIVVNCQNEFKPFAKFLLDKIVKAMLLVLHSAPMNYIIADALVMLIDWAEIATPDHMMYTVTNALLSQLIQKVDSNESSKAITRYNYKILECLVNVWQGGIDFPDCTEYMKNNPNKAVLVLWIFRNQGSREKVPHQTSAINFLINFIKKWKNEDEFLMKAFAALGSFLEFITMSNSIWNELQITQIREFLSKIQDANRRVRCIYTLCTAYPQLLGTFFELASVVYKSLVVYSKVKVLELLSIYIPSLSNDEINYQINYLEFKEILQYKVVGFERICLQITKKLVAKLPASQLLPIIQLTANYSQHIDKEYRGLMYDIFISIFHKYTNTECMEEDAKNLIELTRGLLLSGLADPSDYIQEKLMNFWIRTDKFGKTCPEQILNILDNYSPKIDKDFLSIFGLLFLQFSKASPSYETPLFKSLDQTSNYKNYKISTNSKLRNYRIPLFVSSWASQRSQKFSVASLASGDLSTSSEINLETSPTDRPHSAYTINRSIGDEDNEDDYDDDDDDDDDNDDATFALATVPKTNFSRRFLVKKSHSQRRSAKDSQTRKDRAKYLERRSIEQRSSIKLTRKYRIGDVPDIEINHQAVLNPIASLLHKDPIICKNFIVSIISSLIKKLKIENSKGDDNNEKLYRSFIDKLSKRFEEICTSVNGNIDLIVSAALEIIYNNPEINYKVDSIAHFRQLNGLNALSALLIERKLMEEDDEESGPAKVARFKSNKRNELDNKWIYLAEIYELLNETDLFVSIFCNHSSVEHLDKASSARVEHQWSEAEALYETVCETQVGSIYRHCQRGIFQCLAELSNWEEITSKIDNSFGSDKTVSDFLQISKSPQDGWVVPWYFKSHTHMYFMSADGNGERDYRQQLQLAMNNTKEKSITETICVEELAALCPPSMNQLSKFLVTSALRKMKYEWIQLNPLSVELRFQKMVELRGLCDINLYRDAITGDGRIRDQLLAYWKRSLPQENDDLVSWNIHIARRLHFCEALVKSLQLNDNETCQLQAAVIQQQFALINLAYQQQNLESMRVQLSHFNNTSGNKIPANSFASEFTLNLARLVFLHAKNIENVVELPKLLQKSGDEVFRLQGNSNLPSNVKIQNVRFVVEWSLAMLDLKDKNNDLFVEITRKMIDESMTLPSMDHVEKFIMDSASDMKQALKHCIGVASPRLQYECHLNVIKYCHSKIISGNEKEEYTERFVELVLEAIALGSNEAWNWFPCILNENCLKDNRMKIFFIESTSKMETWRFLKWQSQLLRYLATPLHTVVAGIIDRLVEEYPDALLYTLNASINAMQRIAANGNIHKLSERFRHRTDFYDFVEAMEYLIRPELYLQHQLDNLITNINNSEIGITPSVDYLIQKVYNLRNPNMQGSLYKEYLGPFQRDVLKMKYMQYDEIRSYIRVLKKQLDKSIATHDDSTDLDSYSPYLSEINGSDIIIPGVCNGDRCPQYLPKILRIELKVQVMRSHRKPIKITIIGDDKKSYNFLVKFGEDLRLDQRLQQTCGLVNDILEADLACSERNLSINTYKVIPLSHCVGMIEWLDNTRTFNDFIYFSMNDGQIKTTRKLDQKYYDWIGENCPESAGKSFKYRESLLVHDAPTTVSMMNNLIREVDSSALRRSFIEINPSGESFMSFRKNFITSYAVLCTVQWILGIGDRHLENTLIKVESGKCAGIDLASAFGSGIHQHIPELVPFRLTNQIQKVMEPFDTKDLFGLTMIHVLKALRKNKDLIAAVLAVIMQKDSNWTDYGYKKSELEQPYIDWVVDIGIKTLIRKLNGDNPVDIFVDELKFKHFDSVYFPAYETVVRGWACSNDCARLRFREKTSLTPHEQVEILLDQATDLNCLGRMYYGWRPWM